MISYHKPWESCLDARRDCVHVYVCFFGGRGSRFKMCPNISICCASAASIEICIVLKPLASDGGYLTVEVGTSEPGTDARSVLHVT